MRKAVLCCMMMLLSSAAQAELEIINLHHRSAEDVLPVIRPLLDRDGVASGMNYQLILRTSPGNLAEIRKLLESVDVSPRRLKITVMQNVEDETVRRLTEASGSAGVGRDARISVRGGRDGGGLAVEAGEGADRVRARVGEGKLSREGSTTQQVLVMEGNLALVSVGQSLPIVQRRVVRSPWGAQVEETTQYRDAASGFYVLPRIGGDRVTLEISAQNDEPAISSGSQPVIRAQRVTVTVSGRLGEWLVLGDVSQQATAEGSAISSRNTSNTSERRSVLLKVEEAGN